MTIVCDYCLKGVRGPDIPERVTVNTDHYNLDFHEDCYDGMDAETPEEYVKCAESHASMVYDRIARRDWSLIGTAHISGLRGLPESVVELSDYERFGVFTDRHDILLTPASTVEPRL